jgi:hypothetical protein
MSTTDTFTYAYSFASLLRETDDKSELFLSNYSELPQANLPCFFQGTISNPYIVARTLITLANVVKSNYIITQAQLEAMRDPIVTVGAEQIRFEGFSQCAGVYARVDVTEEGQKEAFVASGTTNVDFNQEMISALGRVSKNSHFSLNVGSKEVAVTTEQHKVTEKKVTLPARWIKSLTAVQHYMAHSKPFATLNRLQTIQLFRSIPKGTVKTDYYLFKRANKYTFSPMAQKDALLIGAINRLHLLQPLLPLLTELKVFSHDQGQSSTWQLYFDTVVFSLTLSRDAYRGFSGEGTQLHELMEEIDDTIIERFSNFSYANQTFSPTLLPIRIGKEKDEIEHLTAKLSAMGLLGYDLDRGAYFYRQLPFKPSRIMTLNPRLKGAKRLVEKNQVKIVLNEKEKIEARVAGTGVEHLVIIHNGVAKCTCQWYSKYQGERGECKHVLAVREIVK